VCSNYLLLLERWDIIIGWFPLHISFYFSRAARGDTTDRGKKTDTDKRRLLSHIYINTCLTPFPAALPADPSDRFFLSGGERNEQQGKGKSQVCVYGLLAVSNLMITVFIYTSASDCRRYTVIRDYRIHRCWKLRSPWLGFFLVIFTLHVKFRRFGDNCKRGLRSWYYCRHSVPSAMGRDELCAWTCLNMQAQAAKTTWKLREAQINFLVEGVASFFDVGFDTCQSIPFTGHSIISNCTVRASSRRLKVEFDDEDFATWMWDPAVKISVSRRLTRCGRV